MPDKVRQRIPKGTWKAFERRIAKSLGTHRTPLSGGASRHTTSDTLHPDLYVECRFRSSSALFGWWVGVRQSATKERKIPVMAIHQKGAKKSLAVIDWDFFLKLYKAYSAFLHDWGREERSDP